MNVFFVLRFPFRWAWYELVDEMRSRGVAKEEREGERESDAPFLQNNYASARS